jgi:hypothetical protein
MIKKVINEPMSRVKKIKRKIKEVRLRFLGLLILKGIVVIDILILAKF